MEARAFLERVRKRLPAARPSAFTFDHWDQGGRPTDEGVGRLPVPGVDAAKLIDAAMDVNHYVGNVEFVATCRSVTDPRFVEPEAVRFQLRGRSTHGTGQECAHRPSSPAACEPARAVRG